jgi:hypothetical protein
MIYVFIGSCQLIIFGFAWVMSNLMFRESCIVPVVVMYIGAICSVMSMYMLGWIY